METTEQLNLGLITTVCLTLAVCSAIADGGDRHNWFGEHTVLSGKQYALRVLVMMPVLLTTIHGFLGDDIAYKVVMNPKKMILLSVLTSIISVQ